jgi:hypothetical protein
VQPTKLEKGFIISTPLKDVVCVDYMYKDLRVNMEGLNIEVNLMPIELYDLDLILQMGSLSEQKAQMDCFAKTVILQGINGRRIIFTGEKNFLPNYVVSDMNAKKMLRNECSTYLTYVKDVEQGGMEINNLLIV